MKYICHCLNQVNITWGTFRFLQCLDEQGDEWAHGAEQRLDGTVIRRQVSENVERVLSKLVALLIRIGATVEAEITLNNLQNRRVSTGR